MQFIIYTTNNNGKKTPLYNSNKYRETLSAYKDFIEKNKKEIIYPLRYTANPKEVRLQKYFILLVKQIADKTEVLKHSEFLVEEKFYVYGLKQRLTVVELFEKVIPKLVDNFTSVRMFKNKIVFECGDTIECVLTKNIYECKRLYMFLKNAMLDKKIISFMFLGKVPESPRSIKIELIKKLVDFTGLSHFQFKRNSTRH